MKKIIAITNQKGGVGKTTTSSALAGGLKLLGYRVLAIDLDPQGNLSFSVGAETDESPTIYDVFKDQATIEDTIQETKTCDILPSNILLSGAELEFNRPGREHILKEAMGDIAQQYDYVIIDTPPALSILTVNAYTVATSI
ncbi:MAG: ParA family protein, partial [Acetanaerobacterium sp.]